MEQSSKDIADAPGGANEQRAGGANEQQVRGGDEQRAGGANEQRADEDPGARRHRENKGSPAEPWAPDEQRYGDTAEQAGQPNLSRDPPASQQRAREDPEPTDAAPS
jgi:hypothetical protein